MFCSFKNRSASGVVNIFLGTFYLRGVYVHMCFCTTSGHKMYFLLWITSQKTKVRKHRVRKLSSHLAGEWSNGNWSSGLPHPSPTQTPKTRHSRCEPHAGGTGRGCCPAMTACEAFSYSAASFCRVSGCPHATQSRIREHPRQTFPFTRVALMKPSWFPLRPSPDTQRRDSVRNV